MTFSTYYYRILVGCIIIPASVISFVPSQTTLLLRNAVGSYHHDHFQQLQQRQQEYVLPLSATTTTTRRSIETIAKGVDHTIVNRLVRIVNHIPTLITIYYFGLISSAMMMGTNTAKMMGAATISSVLIQHVGPTTQATFSQLFPTLVTPASFVFLIWPFISLTQLVTLFISALRPGKLPLLSQSELTSLSLANLFATAWLLISSQAIAGSAVPLGSFLVLPAVAIFSGFPLRRRSTKLEARKLTMKNFIFQIYSSFTTLASLLALAVELQHGGRIPFLTGQKEIVALLYLLLFFDVGYASNNSLVKRAVSLLAITGILWKRIMGVLSVSGGGGFNLGNSLSLIATAGITFILARNLGKGNQV